MTTNSRWPHFSLMDAENDSTYLPTCKGLKQSYKTIITGKEEKGQWSIRWRTPKTLMSHKRRTRFTF